MDLRRTRCPRALFALVGALAIFASPVRARGPGESSGEFLTIYSDARPASLGDAYVALAENAAGIGFNPAGLVRPSTREITASHVSWIGASNFQHLAYTHPVNGVGEAFGISLLRFDAGGFERTNELGLSSGYKLVAEDFSGTVGYGRMIGRYWAVGLSGKYVFRQLDVHHAGAAAVDLGVLWWSPIPNLTAGASIQNLGSRLRFLSDQEPLPLTFRAGLAYRTWLDRVTFSGDVVKVEDENWNLRFGTEVNVMNQIRLRAGWRGDRGLMRGYTAGVGLSVAGVTFDYAYVPFELFGSTHRITGSVKFGGPREPEIHHLPQEAAHRTHFPPENATAIPAPDRAPSVHPPEIIVIGADTAPLRRRVGK